MLEHKLKFVISSGVEMILQKGERSNETPHMVAVPLHSCTQLLLSMVNNKWHANMLQETIVGIM